MEKIIMIDGNNLLFRSYYATAYTGNILRNSKGFPTNALLGFTNMMNKIIKEENPTHIIVAFDKGKTFRHEQYEDYKKGRNETPDDLIKQFPIAKEMLTYMGIKYYEIDNYEADDIIGTFAQYCDEDSNYIGTIISSDRDLLQLISTDVDIKLLRQKDYIRYDLDGFIKEYGITPQQVVDLKSLQGDQSDNIPGVKGIGEKTALKLIKEYGSLNNLYSNIESLKGKQKENLINDKEKAYLSYELATIVKDVPIDIDINDIKYKEANIEALTELYTELEFYSLLKQLKTTTPEELNVKIIKNIKDVKVEGECAVYLEILGKNYHNSEILGMGVYNEKVSMYIPFEVLKQSPKFLLENKKYTYDYKKTNIALKWSNIGIENITYDAMVAGYLLDYNIKDDLAYLANQMNYDLPFYETIYGKTKFKKPSLTDIAYNTVMRAKFIFDTKNTIMNKLEEEQLVSLYSELDFPLTKVLSDMEYTGVNVDRKTLIDMGENIKIRLEVLSNDIYNDAGQTFNISSPLQLGEILFDKLGLQHGKKGKTGYSTAIDVLNKIVDKHPIVNKIIEYRTLSKLQTTYIDGLLNSIMDDHKIHTIFTQTLTRTGRLSSIEPNLQNIPIRFEYGRLIRKAFIASPDSTLLSFDYSQIELRILAHMSGVESLIEAFTADMDIHTKTAMDIFKVDEIEVNPNMRRIAKAVNFGIIYGISSFGLAENLDVDFKSAKQFIDDYLQSYPGVKEYMDNTIKQAYNDGYVKTLLGRKRNIHELSNNNYMVRQQGERIALNTPIQGTSADIIKQAMVEIHKQFKERELESKMILQVHDELIFDVLKEEYEIVHSIVTEVMENVYKLKVPLKVDVNEGKSWYQAM